jgi:hypothetical protein
MCGRRKFKLAVAPVHIKELVCQFFTRTGVSSWEELDIHHNTLEELSKIVNDSQFGSAERIRLRAHIRSLKTKAGPDDSGPRPPPQVSPPAEHHVHKDTVRPTSWQPEEYQTWASARREGDLEGEFAWWGEIQRVAACRDQGQRGSVRRVYSDAFRNIAEHLIESTSSCTWAKIPKVSLFHVRTKRSNIVHHIRLCRII